MSNTFSPKHALMLIALLIGGLAAGFGGATLYNALISNQTNTNTDNLADSNEFDPENISSLDPNEVVTVSHEFISFEYTGSLASTHYAGTMEAVPYTEPQPGGSGNPRHIQFILDPERHSLENMYPPFGKHLLVYPVAEYEQFLSENDFTNDTDQSQTAVALAQKLDELASLQEQGADLETITTQLTTIPVAPVTTAPQVFIAQPTSLQFAGGRGVRFLTTFMHDASPILRDRLLYTFQGLSHDGQYWISFFYPVESELLPVDYESAVAQTNYAETAAQYEGYLGELVSMLTASMSYDFTPDLAELDRLVETITISDDIL